MPVLSDGEFYFATDTNQLYVGLSGISWKIGGPAVGAIEINGNANSNNYLEPQTDGSIVVSLGTAVGKVLIAAGAGVGVLTTTATTNVAIVSYTAGLSLTGANLFVSAIDIQGHLTTLSATASVLGTVYLEIGSNIIYQTDIVNPTTSDVGGQSIRLNFSEPLPVPNGTVIKIGVIPSAVTSMKWTANILGYERIPL